MKKVLFGAVALAFLMSAQLSAYEKGDILLDFEVGLGTSWGTAEGDSSDYGFEFEVGGKAGYFFTDVVAVMGGLSIDYFNTPYSYSEESYSLEVDVSAICLTIPAGIYVSPYKGLIFGGGFSLSIPFINMSEGTVTVPGYGTSSDSGDNIVKFSPFMNFYIDGGYDFGETTGKGMKLLLRYSKSLTNINSDEGKLTKDFLHVMIGYSYITY
ncbi:MAG: porin family protein [Spirochaetales bacterium]|jgi:hypothetical protein|nr:porin family protein [Spirochaetales bacterium]